jgi:hypothetical protein
VSLTRERLEESPELAAHRAGALADLDELEASLVLPIVFRGSVTGIFALGDKRSGAAYSTFDLRVLRLVANQSAVAIENACAYTALQQAIPSFATPCGGSRSSSRSRQPVQVRPRHRAAADRGGAGSRAAKREVDVSVLFVDIAGYTLGDWTAANVEKLRRLPRRDLALQGDVNDGSGSFRRRSAPSRAPPR